MSDDSAEVMMALPEGWEWTTLGEVAPVRRKPPGLPARKSVAFVPMALISERGSTISTFETRDGTSVNGTYFEEGDLLLSRITPSFENGKQGIVLDVPGGYGYATTEVYPLNCSVEIAPDFLNMMLRSQGVRRALIPMMAGATGRMRLPERVVEGFRIPLPPRREQALIIKAIGEEFGRLDAIEKELDGVDLLMEQFRNALLRDAFSGHLVLPHAEPDGERVDSNGRPELPQRWEWRTLGDLCDRPAYGWTTRASQEGAVKLLRTTDITNGPISWPDVPCCEVAPDDLQRYGLRAGDLVISRTGAGAGSSALISTEPPSPTAFASYLIRFRPQQDVSSNFLAYFLSSHGFWAQVAATASGLKKNINATKLSAIQVPVPSLAEQELIVAALDVELSRLDGVRAVAGEARIDLTRIRDSVLHRAFIGQLVATTQADGDQA
jgi:type I restriction enzyme S subunit